MIGKKQTPYWRKARKRMPIVAFREVEPKEVNCGVVGELIHNLDGTSFFATEGDILIRDEENEIHAITKRSFLKDYEELK